MNEWGGEGTGTAATSAVAAALPWRRAIINTTASLPPHCPSTQVGANRNQSFVEFATIDQAVSIVTHYSRSAEPGKLRGRPTWLSYRCGGRACCRRGGLEVRRLLLLLSCCLCMQRRQAAGSCSLADSSPPCCLLCFFSQRPRQADQRDLLCGHAHARAASHGHRRDGAKGTPAAVAGGLRCCCCCCRRAPSLQRQLPPLTALTLPLLLLPTPGRPTSCL